MLGSLILFICKIAILIPISKQAGTLPTLALFTILGLLNYHPVIRKVDGAKFLRFVLDLLTFLAGVIATIIHFSIWHALAFIFSWLVGEWAKLEQF